MSFTSLIRISWHSDKVECLPHLRCGAFFHATFLASSPGAPDLVYVALTCPESPAAYPWNARPHTQYEKPAEAMTPQNPRKNIPAVSDPAECPWRPGGNRNNLRRGFPQCLFPKHGMAPALLTVAGGVEARSKFASASSFPNRKLSARPHPFSRTCPNHPEEPKIHKIDMVGLWAPPTLH